MSSRPDGATSAAALELQRRGSEWVGPCPRCGGTDRFHVRADGVFGCRVCGEDDNAGLYRAVMDACGYDGGTDTDTWRPSQWPATRRRPEPKANNTGPGLRGVAQAAWDAASPPTDTPAQRYLSHHRRIWPAARALPPSVRWLPLRRSVPDTMRWALDAITEPDAISGVILYAYTTTTGGTINSAKCEALDAGGARQHEAAGPWKRNYGARDGALFVALDAPGGDWHLVEGEADALAIASTLDAGRVVCASGTSGFAVATCADAVGRRIILHPDNDVAGVRAAWKLLAALTRAGIAADVEPSYNGTDPAAELAVQSSTTHEKNRGQ